MKRKIKTNLIFIFILLLIVYFVILNKTKINPKKEMLDDTKTIALTSKLKKKEKNNENSLLLELEPMSEDIKELNSKLPYYFDYTNDNSIINEVGQLSVKPREDSSDVLEKIIVYLSDVSKYQIQIASLQNYCYKNKDDILSLENSIKESKLNINEMSFNSYYFHLGLRESEFCKRTGTKKDIFWMFLELARNGDEIAQLELLKHLITSVDLNRFNIKKYPQEYMQLRDEGIDYLTFLASKGVHRASDTLGRIYKGSKYYNFVEQNLLLSYYYYSLAVKQSGFELLRYRTNPDVIYEKLSDKQKIIADRMTENL